MDKVTTWNLIHAERSATAEMLDGLTPDQWATPSMCAGWSVQVAAAHIVGGAEQTPANFAKRMVASGMRFNKMIDHDARKLGAVPTAEIVRRLQDRITTTNGPPGPVGTMLGEIVVHSEDIRQPLGMQAAINPQAIEACLANFSKANFPVGTKSRIAGLRLVVSDGDWSFGSGPEVSGTGIALLSVMTGRRPHLDDLVGEGVVTLRERMASGV
jgi:uncharacterized protein (TIGR03083 family)